MLALCGWLLLNFWILPLSTTRWKAVGLREKIIKVGSIAAVEKLRDLLAVAGITLTAILILVQLGDWGAGTSRNVSAAVIEKAKSSYDVLDKFADVYGEVVGVFGLLGAVIALAVVAKRAHERMARAWIEQAKVVRARMERHRYAIVGCLNDAELRPFAERVLALMSRLEAAASLTVAERVSLREELSNALTTLALEKALRELDLDRTISEPDAAEAASRPSVWSRIGRVLSSERLCKDLGFFEKPFSYASTSLIVISLIGWSAAPMADSLRLAINNLRINADASQVQRNVEQAMSVALQIPAINAPPAPSVQSATKVIVTAAMRKMMRSQIVSGIVKSERNPLAETEYVRAAIIGKQISPVGSSEPVTKLRTEIADSVAKAANEINDPSELARHIEKQVEPLVEQLHKESPGLLQRLIATLEARYATPVGALDAQEKLLEKIFDLAAGGIDANPATELGKQGQKLVSDFGKKTLNTWLGNFARSFVADLVVEAARPDVRHVFHQAPAFEASASTREFLNEFAAAAGKHWDDTGPAGEEVRMAAALAKTVAGEQSSARRALISDGLAGYEALFPSQLGAGVGSSGGSGSSGSGGSSGSSGSGGSSGSSGGDAERRWQPDGGTVGETEAGSGGGRSFAQLRATTFRLASRSAYARGVVIGRDYSAKDVAIDDLRWTMRPAGNGGATGVGLELKVDRTWRDIGAFEAAVVNQALRYGADRRVVATTITPGDGEIVQRVTSLHPALADTPLGCRVVELDRVIDALSDPKSDAGPPIFEQMRRDRTQMDYWLKVLTLADIVSNARGGGTCPVVLIDQRVKKYKLGEVGFSKAMTATVDRFIAEEEGKRPGSTQFFAKAHQCAIGPKAQLAQCLCDLAASPAAAISPYWMPLDHTSQVREREARLTRDLSWLRRSPDRLGAVDFWVHTTLALHVRPLYGESRVDDDASTAAIDFPADQLTSLRAQVQARLSQYLSTRLRNPSMDEFMSPVEDFILLQRLFRAGLDGRFGANFPTAKLITLERQTRPFVPSQPTIRWEADLRGGPLAGIREARLLAALEKTGAKALETYRRWIADMSSRREQGRPVCDRASN